MSSITASKFSRSKRYSRVKSAHCFRARSGAFANPYPGKSVKYHVPSPVTISKWLIVCVLPGFLLVFATSFFVRPVSMLIRELFPTLLRPMTAISGCFGGGQSSYLKTRDTPNPAAAV